jgi:hypothetical protein
MRSRPRFVGALVRLDEHTLVLRDSVERQIERASIRSVEVSQGRGRRTGRGAFIGFIAGAGAGVVGTLVWCGRPEGCSGSSGNWTGLLAAAVGAIGAVGGTGIGALLGSRISGERWHGVPFDEVTSRGFGLGVRVTF